MTSLICIEAVTLISGGWDSTHSLHSARFVSASLPLSPSAHSADTHALWCRLLNHPCCSLSYNPNAFLGLVLLHLGDPHPLVLLFHARHDGQHQQRRSQDPPAKQNQHIRGLWGDGE